MSQQPNLLNRRVLLSSRPQGLPETSHFAQDTVPAANPEPGEVLVETLYVSVDPAMRVWMNEDPGYVPPIALGDVMRATGIGRVLESQDPAFVRNDLVIGRLGWQSHPVIPAAQLSVADPSIGSARDWMGPLGSTGLTAYFGIKEVGSLASSDQVLVSAASGGVGQMAAQIAKLEGCRVVGTAGGADKCAYLERELGLDQAVDYKAASELGAALDHAFPEGIDVYFDNVGGPLLEAVLPRLRLRGRVVICGRISQTAATERFGITNLGELIGKRARVEGFIVSDFAARFDDARRWLSERIQDGRLQQRIHLLEGIETAPDGLAMLFRGGNTGKLLVQVAKE